MPKGKLIIFDGIDGAGKSTVIKLCELMITKPCFKVREIENFNRIDIRGWLLRPEHRENQAPISTMTELLVIEASRAILYHDHIVPLLADDNVILCDRGPLGSIVYQGHGRGLSKSLIWDLNHGATMGIKPDLNFIFTLPKAMAKERLAKRGIRLTDPFENDQEFFDRIYDGWNQILSQDTKLVKIDASKPVSDVVNQCMTHINKLFQ